MKQLVVVVMALMMAGYAQRACVSLLEKAESKYQNSLAGARREVSDAESDKTISGRRC